jgi:hypothetical protein
MWYGSTTAWNAGNGEMPVINYASSEMDITGIVKVWLLLANLEEAKHFPDPLLWEI